jgi:hypothetical protein
MATYVVSGAGTSAYDGTYVEYSTYEGKPSYTNGTYYLCWFETQHEWFLTQVHGATGYAGYASYGTTDPDTKAWSLENPAYATDPAPTVTLGGASGLPMGNLHRNMNQIQQVRYF